MLAVSDSDLRKSFQKVQRVAILGASLNPARAGYYVSTYLHKQEFSIFPINPKYVGSCLENRPFAASLSDIDEPIDTVNIVRASHLLLDHLPEILDLVPLPYLAWFQPGSQNHKLASALLSAGITVIQHRCMFTEHKRLH